MFLYFVKNCLRYFFLDFRKILWRTFIDIHLAKAVFEQIFVNKGLCVDFRVGIGKDCSLFGNFSDFEHVENVSFLAILNESEQAYRSSLLEQIQKVIDDC